MGFQAFATEKYYDKVDAKKWERIKAAVAGYGIQIDQPKGQGKSFGVTLSWDWDSTGKLHVAIIDSGLLEPAEAMAFIDPIILNA